MELRAFHGNGMKPAALKKALVREMEKHRDADEIIKGTYGEQNGSFKACAVGCSIHSLNELQGKKRETSSHAVFEQVGIPQSLAHLQDSIFEGLPNGENSAFAVDFWKAIRPGADLSKVTAQFLVWTLLDKKHGAICHAPADKFKECHDAILACALLWKNYLKTGKYDRSAAWSAARSAARSAASAAWSAAWSAAKSAAWSAEIAARSAARSAASAAWSAAWSAAKSAAWSAEIAAKSAERSAARSAFWQAAAATLLKLLAKA